MTITINGTTGISGVDGSAGTPSLQGQDTNTGFFYGSDILGFSTGGTERMRIDSSGNVGIGTNSPVQKLHVNGAAQIGDTQISSSIIEINNSGTGNRYSVIDFHGDDTYTDYGLRIVRGNTGANTNSELIHRGTGSLNLVAIEAAPVAFWTSSAERMRVDSNGYVGVGTSSPNANFTVQQASATTGGPVLSLWNSNATAGNTCGYIRFYSNTTARAELSSVIDSGSPFAGNFVFKTGETTLTERVRIDSTGNVGIGTSSPAVPLDVQGTAAQFRLTNGTVDMRMYPYTSGSSGIAGTWSNHAYVLNTNNTERMRIDSSGNVGIGTSSPNTKLEVYGGRIRVNATPDPGIEFVNTAAVKGYVFFDTTNDLMTMRHQASSGAVAINSSGYMLVGTTSYYNSTVSNTFYRTASQPTVHVVNDQNANVSPLKITRYPSDGDGLTFFYGATQKGYISVLSTGTTYNTLSDYRLKENVKPMTGALAKVAQLKPVTYDWIGLDKKGQGFIAHELQAVVPECVTGEKDGVDDNGDPKYQGVDTSFLVATLTAAIQELTARVIELEKK